MGADLVNQARSCPICGRTPGSDDRFCSGCGARLDVRALETQAPRASLDEVFAHLRSGEQRPATILMTDVSGFSTLGENVQPEWLFHLINQVFGELVDCLVSHGAHIDKYVGDEIVALFGIPTAQERSAERAVLAALAMRERLAELNSEGRFGDVRPGIHTGINVGPVMVGPVGHRDYLDYTVIGDAVNVAKRLEAEAPEGEIYVSQAVRDAVGEELEVERIGPVSLAGRQQPVGVFRVLGVTRTGIRAEVDTGAEGPLMAREAELERIVGFSELAREGQETCVCVVGAPGIGKSRLIGAWCRSGHAERYRVLATTCHAYGEHFPLLPLVDLVGQLAGLRLEGWPPRVPGDVEALTTALPVREGARSRIASMLRSPGSPPEELAADAYEALSDSLVELLRGATSEQPICLVLEGLQWLDEASREVMSKIALRGRDLPLFVLASAREPVAEWIQEALEAELVALEPLTREVMQRLVAAWAVPDVLPADTVQAVCDRAEGHPLFARELVRALRNTPGPEAAAVSLPATLQELFLVQFDELPIPLKRLVQAASVVGEPFSQELLEAAMSGDPTVTSALLTEATQRGLLRTGPAAGQYVYGRRLLFESAYATIPPTQRTDVHARIADDLSARLDELGEGAVHIAAYHAYLGYGDERALDPLLRSTRLYRSQYANRQAIRVAGHVLEVVGSLPEPEGFVNERLEALLMLGESRQVTGEVDRAQGTLAEAELLVEECDNEELRARIATSAATLCWMLGRRDEAEERFGRARDTWERLGDVTRVAQTVIGIGLCAQQAGDRGRALNLFSQAATMPGCEPWARAAALNNAGMLLLQEGRYGAAQGCVADGLRANEECADPRGVAHSKCSLGEVCYRLADLEEAERWLGEAIEEAEEVEDPQCRDLATLTLARAHCLKGDIEAAHGLLGALTPAEELDDPEAISVRRLVELEVALAGKVQPETTASPEQDGSRAPLEPGEPFECEDQENDVCWNAYVEALCLELEAAVREGQWPRATQVAAILAPCVERVCDRHLQRYGRWLLDIPAEEGGPLSPLPSTDDGEWTVFDVRAKGLAECLCERP